MRCALAMSELSYAQRKKVGAILVSPQGNIIAEGLNGTPAGDDNRCETGGSDLVTKPEVLHAESNAIAKVAKSTNSSVGSTLYCTLSCCFECAKLIIQAEISRFVYLEEYRDTSGLDRLRKSGIRVDKIELD
jgi:dCMP deaminase